MARRRAAIEALLAQAECDHLVFCGANRFGSVVQWLTQWPVTAEAVGVFTPGERDALFVQYVNHAPQARIWPTRPMWPGAVSRRSPPRAGAGKAGRAEGRIATIGPLSAEQHAALSAQFGTSKSLNATTSGYVR